MFHDLQSSYLIISVLDEGNKFEFWGNTSASASSGASSNGSTQQEIIAGSKVFPRLASKLSNIGMYICIRTRQRCHAWLIYIYVNLHVYC